MESPPIRKSLREAEEERMRKAYLANPDSEAEADDWTNPEEWKPLLPVAK
jgi:hypothetical protein